MCYNYINKFVGVISVKHSCNYYKDLQVDISAEAEVIEAAYKRLCKKYHPDVCKDPNADGFIKRLNTAYEVLRDPIKRKNFDRQIGVFAKSKAPFSINSSDNAIITAIEYFSALSRKEYSLAYDLISSKDKKNISLDDFILWQKAVSKIYSIIDCTCCRTNISEVLKTSDFSFDEYAEINVHVYELNVLENKTVEENLTRTLLKESDNWRIFLGYQDVKLLTKKYELLADRSKVEKIMEWWLEHSEKTDLLTGLPNEIGFFDIFSVECERYRRYNNPFSIAILTISLNSTILQELGEQKIELLRKIISSIIKNRLRSTDSLGIDNNLTYFLLLPETDGIHAKDALFSISKHIEQFVGIKNICYAGISEYLGQNPVSFFDFVRNNMVSSITYKKNIIFSNMNNK